MNPNSSDNRYEHVIESLKFLFEKYRGCDEGTLATYIPELSKADPSWLGIALADVDGNVLEFGDSQIEFTIQSVSKPFIFGAALDVLGRDEVLKRVGVEPSGDSFNGIEFQKGERPYNAMINPVRFWQPRLFRGAQQLKKFRVFWISLVRRQVANSRSTRIPIVPNRRPGIATVRSAIFYVT